MRVARVRACAPAPPRLSKPSEDQRLTKARPRPTTALAKAMPCPPPRPLARTENRARPARFQRCVVRHWGRGQGGRCSQLAQAEGEAAEARPTARLQLSQACCSFSMACGAHGCCRGQGGCGLWRRRGLGGGGGGTRTLRNAPLALLSAAAGATYSPSSPPAPSHSQRTLLASGLRASPRPRDDAQQLAAARSAELSPCSRDAGCRAPTAAGAITVVR
jgi:hypothetical protein